jgi:hypothetical protein
MRVALDLDDVAFLQVGCSEHGNASISSLVAIAPFESGGGL